MKKFNIHDPDVNHPEFKEHVYDLVKNMQKKGMPINTKAKRALNDIKEYKKIINLDKK